MKKNNIYKYNLCTYICIYFKIKVVLKLYSANEKVSNAIMDCESMDLAIKYVYINLPADTLRVLLDKSIM